MAHNPSKLLAAELAAGIPGLPNIRLSRKERQSVIVNLVRRCRDKKGHIRPSALAIKLSDLEIVALIEAWNLSVKPGDL